MAIVLRKHEIIGYVIQEATVGFRNHPKGRATMEVNFPDQLESARQ
jgi:hypothetical protein